MTVTLYNVSKYVPDLLGDFTFCQNQQDNKEWINLKVFDVGAMTYDGKTLRLEMMDRKLMKHLTSNIDARLFIYFDVV